MGAHSEKFERDTVLVRHVLELPALQEAGVRLVAGESGADNEVRWVHAGEIDDIATFLEGGELLFSAGTGINQTDAGLRGYVERLAAVGASALVLEVAGRAFSEPPEAICRRADELGFPVAVLEREVPFAGVMRTVHRMIIGRQYELVERAEGIAVEFSALLLSGGNVAHVVHKLGELTMMPIVLEDAAHQVVEYSKQREVTEIIANWRAHSRASHQDETGDVTGAHQAPTDPACCWAAVTVRGAVWGRLHMLAMDRPIGPVDRLAVERASAAIGLALLTRTHDLQEAERSRSELIADLMRRAPDDIGEFLRRSRALGADLADRSLFVLAFDGAGKEGGPDRIAATIRRRATQMGVAFLAASQGDRSYLLAGVHPTESTDATIADFAEQVASAANPTVGVSSPVSAHALPQAFNEADECLRYARLAGTDGVHRFTQLGLHLLLLLLAERRELAPFIEHELGRVLEADARSKNALLPTLRAILECEGNKVLASRQLNIERRSLYYRLEKLERVLGRSLKSPDTRIGLSVALRALDLTEDQARTSRSATVGT